MVIQPKEKQSIINELERRKTYLEQCVDHVLCSTGNLIWSHSAHGQFGSSILASTYKNLPLPEIKVLAGKSITCNSSQISKAFGKLSAHPVGVFCLLLEPPKCHIMQTKQCRQFLGLGNFLYIFLLGPLRGSQFVHFCRHRCRLNKRGAISSEAQTSM